MSYADNINDQWVKTKILPNPQIDNDLSKLVNFILINVNSYSKFQKLPIDSLIDTILKNTSIHENILKDQLHAIGMKREWKIPNNTTYQLLTLLIRIYRISGDRHQKVFKNQAMIALITLMYMSIHRSFWPKGIIDEVFDYTITNKLPVNSLWKKFQTPIQYFVFLKDETFDRYNNKFETMTLAEQTNFIINLYYKIRSVTRNVAFKYYEVQKSKEYIQNTTNDYDIILRTITNEIDRSFRFKSHNNDIVTNTKSKHGTPEKTSISIYNWLANKPDMFVDLVKIVLSSIKPTSYKYILTPKFETDVFKNLKTKAIKGNTIKVKTMVDDILNSYLKDSGQNKLLSFSSDKVVKLRKTVLFLAYSHIIDAVTHKVQ